MVITMHHFFSMSICVGGTAEPTHTSVAFTGIASNQDGEYT